MYGGGGDRLPADFRVEHDQTGEQVAQPDPPQYAGVTLVGELEPQQAIVDCPQQDQQQPAADDPPMQRRPALAPPFSRPG